MPVSVEDAIRDLTIRCQPRGEHDPDEQDPDDNPPSTHDHPPASRIYEGGHAYASGRKRDPPQGGAKLYPYPVIRSGGTMMTGSLASR